MSKLNPLAAALTLSVLAHGIVFFLPYAGAGRQEAPRTDFIFADWRPRQAVRPNLPVSAPKAEKIHTSGPGALPVPGAAASPPLAQTAPAGTVSSEELLSDPQKGKVFSRYFQAIKARIQTVAERHQRFVVRDQGKIEMYFVLNRAGLVISLEARPNQASRRNPLLVSRAMDIIRDSEPFQRFPAEIEAHSISFNITLVFDG